MAEDCTEQPSLSLESIIDNLAARYAQDKIYTYTGTVLLAVNPYKAVASPDPLAYRGRSFRSNPPHPFALADSALRLLLAEGRSQALVISGESGAGKTETARLILQYFTALGQGGKIGNPEMIGNLVAQSTEILEAFGNAATTRNLNSSRFGKFQKLYFANSDPKNKFPIFLGSLVQPFLLETSRVPGVAAGERNFHVFYRLLAGASDARLAELGLEQETRTASVWPMLGTDRKSEEISEDAKKWQELVQALELSGFSCGDRKFLEEALAGILHLSAMQEISDHHSAHAARLLGVSEISLQSFFATRQVAIGNRENYQVTRSETESEIFRRSLMRTAYQRLFEWVNRKFCKISDPSAPSIGCLDIFGFEKFPINGLEQLLINLVNEKLQEFFLDRVIEGERRAMLAEGVSNALLHISGASDAGALRIREISRVLEILDDHCLRRAKNLDTDETKFWRQVLDGGHSHGHGGAGVARPGTAAIVGGTKKRESRKFVVQHYAGEVEYVVGDWIDRNNDRKFPEIEQLLDASTNAVLGGNGGADAKSGFSSVRRKFQESAGSLLETVGVNCQGTQFVRCFNPNDQQISDHFSREYVGQQLTHSGTLELVRVMKEGFPCRQNLEAIFAKYGNLLGEISQEISDKRMFAEILMADVFRAPRNSFRVGLHSLFLKTGLMEISDQLEIADLSHDIRKKITARKFRRVLAAVRVCATLQREISEKRRKARLLEILAAVARPVLIARRLAKRAVENFRRKAAAAQAVAGAAAGAAEAEEAADAAAALGEAAEEAEPLQDAEADAEAEAEARAPEAAEPSAASPAPSPGRATEEGESRKSSGEAGERRVQILGASDGAVYVFERNGWRLQDGNGRVFEFPIKRSFWSVAQCGEEGTFAAADKENTVVVWKFPGSGVLAKFSIHPKGGEANFMTRHVKFYERKFLCLVVEQKTVGTRKFPINTASPRTDLIARFAPPPRTSMTRSEISESTFYMVLLEIGKNSKFSVHSTIAIGVSATQTLPQTVAFLEISGNFLVAGGRGCLQFMQIRRSSDGGAKTAKLEMIGNQNSFRDLSANTFTCALFIGNAAFIGCASGNIYRFVLDENGNFDSEECGRLRQGHDGLQSKRIVSLVRKFTDSDSAVGFLAITACGRVDEWGEKSDGRWTRVASHGRLLKHVTTVKDTSDADMAIFDGKSKTLFSMCKSDLKVTPVHTYSH